MAKVGKKKGAAVEAEAVIKTLKSYSASRKNSSDAFVRSDLAKFDLQNPIILRGVEHFRLRRFVQVVNDVLFGGAKDSISSYFPLDLSSPSVVDGLFEDARGGSLFTRNGIVALYEADALRASTIEKLGQIFQLESSQRFFIFIVSNTEKSLKNLDAIVSQGLAVSISELQGAQLAKWIPAEVIRLGHTGGIEAQALEVLVKSFSNDPGRLVSELSKLVLFVDPSQQIGLKDIKLLSLAEVEANTFQLIEATADKLPGQVTEILKNLEEQGLHPLQILALLSKSIRTLISAMESTKPADFWILKNLPRARSKFNLPQLQSALSQLAKLDLALKGSKRDGNEILQEFVIGLATR